MNTDASGTGPMPRSPKQESEHASLSARSIEVLAGGIGCAAIVAALIYARRR